MLHFLNETAFRLIGEDTTWAELIGDVAGFVCVWLVIKEHILNWPIGNLNVALLMLVFWSSKLYGDAGLQVIYVVLGFYGWWQWARRGPKRDALVRRTTKVEWWWLAIGGLVATAALYWADVRLGSTAPAADAVTTALSLVATYGQCRKLVESWWFWIVADLLYVPLYIYKDLYLTTALYAVFLGMAVVGLRQWRRSLAAAVAVEPEPEFARV
jgi:nicotinamide mononucleotide transporter